MTTATTSPSSSLTITVVLFVFLQLIVGRPQHHFGYAASSTSEVPSASSSFKGTITYQHNVTGWDAISLRCDAINSTIGPICKVETTIYGNCLTSYTNDVFGDTPYFLPTSKDDYLEITNCLDGDDYYVGDDDDDDDDDDTIGTNSTNTTSRFGLVTVTCDAACTCETGSYPESGDGGATLDFEPDGETCPIVSTQPNEQLGPSTPLGPDKYFSSYASSLKDGENLYVVCEGREEDEPVFGVCTLDSGFFSSSSSTLYDNYHHRLDYRFSDCLGVICSVKCPSVCNCTVVIGSNTTGDRNCDESDTSPSLEPSLSSSKYQNPMYLLFRAMGLIALSTSILDSL